LYMYVNEFEFQCLLLFFSDLKLADQHIALLKP
jgi:hypothetical protein